VQILKKWKGEYENIQVPEELREKIEESIKRARKEKRKMKKRNIYKMLGSVAAVLAIMIILPNTSKTAAAAMQQMPILGDFFKVVTIREYQVDEERNMANVKVPEVRPTEDENRSEETMQQAQKSVEEINQAIQQETDKLIEEFKANLEADGGYQDIYSDSTVLTDDERWFSLELVLYQGAGSGYEQHRHYTIDKTTGKRAELKDFYGEDYIETISEQIKNQMREQMEKDENVIYFLDSDMPEWDFKEIKEEQDFYINTDGKVVVCFDEYEVAPGYMGCVEFVLD